MLPARGRQQVVERLQHVGGTTIAVDEFFSFSPPNLLPHAAPVKIFEDVALLWREVN